MFEIDFTYSLSHNRLRSYCGSACIDASAGCSMDPNIAQGGTCPTPGLFVLVLNALSRNFDRFAFENTRFHLVSVAPTPQPSPRPTPMPTPQPTPIPPTPQPTPQPVR